MFPPLTHCKNGMANAAETQEHLEVSSGLKATCCFPPAIIESEQAVFTIQKQHAM